MPFYSRQVSFSFFVSSPEYISLDGDIKMVTDLDTKRQSSALPGSSSIYPLLGVWLK